MSHQHAQAGHNDESSTRTDRTGVNTRIDRHNDESSTRTGRT
jgi:hypothetical protein